jgi:hypothetical protein
LPSRATSGRSRNQASEKRFSYLNAALEQLRAQGYPVREEDVARLSPFVSRHLGVHGTYNFLLPDLAPGAIRELRDPDAPGDDDEEED